MTECWFTLSENWPQVYELLVLRVYAHWVSEGQGQWFGWWVFKEKSQSRKARERKKRYRRSGRWWHCTNLFINYDGSIKRKVKVGKQGRGKKCYRRSWRWWHCTNLFINISKTILLVCVSMQKLGQKGLMYVMYEDWYHGSMSSKCVTKFSNFVHMHPAFWDGQQIGPPLYLW